MDVIHGRPEMTMRSDLAIEAPVPGLSPSALILAVPLE